MGDSGTAADFYTRWAGLYDRLAVGAPFVAGLRAAFADALAPAAGDVVVEMGCGTGANLPYFRERVAPGGTVVGVDVAAGVLERARRDADDGGAAAGRAAGDTDATAHLVRGDATRAPFGGRGAMAVDHVAGAFVSGMVADPGSVVDRWCDLAGPGGRVALLELARSTTPLGRLLNPAFRAFVRAGAPPGARSRRASPAATLDRRVRDAHRRVHERCADARTERQLGGFARITAGTVD